MRNIVIKSSIELTSEQKIKLEAGIRAKESEELTFSYVTENVVGGIAVIDGENLIDATFGGELQRIKRMTDKLVNDSHKNGIDVNLIPQLLKEILAKYVDHKPDKERCGKVISAADGVVTISGLSDCRYGELLLVGSKGFALVMNLEKTTVGAILLSDNDAVMYGDYVFSTGKIIEVPVGSELLGRVVNPLGQPIDGKGVIHYQHTRRIENEAPRIIDRQKVDKPLSTGILAIDSMVPIGRGQRELIIGDRQTGKTSIAIDTIINQKDKNVICIYVAIGQRASTVSRLIKTLEDNGAMGYTTVVLSTASDSIPMQYIAPYTGCAMAEEFMYAGKDVLVVYDDISKHAVAYRAISLLLKRPSGREAYPGDIFYIHSKLLERSARLSDKAGGGSITALPIIETLAGDISAYIPTNVISITDGQIYLEEELFNAGQRPAINVGLSVSRVGGSAQTSLVRKLSSQLRLDIAHYRELAVFAQFGSSLDDTTKAILQNGAKMVEALKQPECKPLSPLKEVLYLYLIVKGHLSDIGKDKIAAFLSGAYNYIAVADAPVCSAIKEDKALSDSDFARLEDCIKQYKISFVG